MAIIERRESAKDWVSIYFTGNEWKLVNTFEISNGGEIADAADLMWCKEDTSILVYDSPLDAKISIYSAMTGECVARHHTSLTQVGSLGIKQVILSPDMRYVASAMFENKIVKLYNGISMKEVASLEHQT